VTGYVAGFAFSEDQRRVVLIEKKRPRWQAGKLNGVGGHIEVGETPEFAMTREYLEETGVASFPHEWTQFAYLVGPEFYLHFYAAFNDKLLDVKTLTDEAILNLSLRDFGPSDVIPNLKWLIPLALDSKRENFNLVVGAEYLR
jgi:8-oxo-dGTP diphosphatase